ncbi:hypothetical protein OTU49_012343, partial [Cherax quadricarinatus]
DIHVEEVTPEVVEASHVVATITVEVAIHVVAATPEGSLVEATVEAPATTTTTVMTIHLMEDAGAQLMATTRKHCKWVYLQQLNDAEKEKRTCITYQKIND